MSVEAADFLITAGGRLNPAWFDGDVNTLLDAWIARATPGSDDLVTARVYYTAFTFLSDQVMSEAAMQRDRDKTTQYSAEQLRYWADQARYYRGIIDGFENVGGPVITSWEGRREHDGRLR